MLEDFLQDRLTYLASVPIQVLGSLEAVSKDWTQRHHGTRLQAESGCIFSKKGGEMPVPCIASVLSDSVEDSVHPVCGRHLPDELVEASLTRKNRSELIRSGRGEGSMFCELMMGVNRVKRRIILSKLEPSVVKTA